MIGIVQSKKRTELLQKKIAFLKKNGHLAYWVFEKRPDDRKKRKELEKLACQEFGWCPDENIYYRLNVVWDEHYDEFAGNRCEFDNRGVCHALGCYSNQICGARDRNGIPAYK